MGAGTDRHRGQAGSDAVRLTTGERLATLLALAKKKQPTGIKPRGLLNCIAFADRIGRRAIWPWSGSNRHVVRGPVAVVADNRPIESR